MHRHRSKAWLWIFNFTNVSSHALYKLYEGVTDCDGVTQKKVEIAAHWCKGFSIPPQNWRGGGRPVGDPDVFRKKMNKNGTKYGGSTKTESICMVWAGSNKKHAVQKLRYVKVRLSAHLNPT